MFSIEEKSDSIHFTISSEMKLADRVVRHMLDFLDEAKTSDISGIKLVLRELLINAIEHGNSHSRSRKVKCAIEGISESRYKVTVEDEGNGFDHQNINMVIPDNPTKIRNRGYPLINALSDGVEFNECGNVVTAYITLDSETEFCSTNQGDGWQLIKPSGDITASTSNKLRELLLELMDDGSLKYRFDLGDVEDIDSVGLSTMIVLSRMLADKQEQNAELQVVNVSNNVKQLFKMTRLDMLYKVV